VDINIELFKHNVFRTLQQLVLHLLLLLVLPSYQLSILVQANTMVDQKFEGKHIKGDQSDPIYLVLDQKLRHVASPAVWEALFGKGEWKFETVPQALVDNFAKGPALDQTTPLIKGDGDPVYLIDEKKKRWISSPDVFKRYGFSWDTIRSVGSVAELLPDGPKIE
jgi:hypothetical protein